MFKTRFTELAGIQHPIMQGGMQHLGIPALAYVPAFFLLATQSFSAACALAGWAAGQGRRELPYHREHFFRCGVCAAAVCLGVFLERYVVPTLVISWAEMLIK